MIFRSRRIVLIPLLMAALTAMSCSDESIPARELSEAREQISLAEKENARTHAPEKLEKAEDSLVQAHSALSENELESARKNAEQARQLAIEARAVAAPLYTREKRETSEKDLQDAQQMQASQIAPEEMQSAEKAMDRGKTYEQKAATLADEEGKEQQSVNAYQDSYTAYDEAGQKAAAARSATVSYRNELTFKANGIEEKINEAEKYNASRTATEPYEGAVQALASGREAIRDSQWETAESELDRADTLAREAVDRSVVQYAENRIQEAQTAMSEAQSNYQNTEKKYEGKKGEQAARILSLTSDYVAAGNEALQSAKSSFQGNDYNSAIDDADEAINTAAVINEQLAGMPAPESQTEQVASADTESQGNQMAAETDTGEQQQQTDAEQQSGFSGEGELYTVKDTTPPDCLWCIAKKKYKKGTLWDMIYKANKKKIQNPHWIYPGQKFVIPPREEAERNKKATQSEGQ